ncbi:MAG: hypothetical protein R3B68_04870 [Phycisphaerales bacterium]
MNTALSRESLKRVRVGLAVAAVCIGTGLLGAAFVGGADAPPDAPEALGPFTVLAYNDLGMHCMQRDFSHFMILPPYNTIQAVVIKRGNNPDIITESGSDFSLTYTIPSNTHSADKTNWWEYQHAILGVDTPPDVGLTGNGMSGQLEVVNGRWEVTGIPITPVSDSGIDDPYPLALLTFLREGQAVARTQTVVPVSWEISCYECHGQAGVGVEVDILRDHDTLHGTNLEASQPVFCASCHADPALGAPGQPGISAFSIAMHRAHAPRMGALPPTFVNECYACHPGARADCQRDVHSANQINCIDCHGGMAAVGNPARTPWVTEPRCADCHSRPGFEFEPQGVLFRNAVGHGGVACFACHGSPHAVTPAVNDRDNLQTLRLQGHTGPINDCLVCHTQQPGQAFFHRRED